MLCASFMQITSKGVRKAIHDIMHAGARRGEAFLYTRGELRLCLYMNV